MKELDKIIDELKNSPIYTMSLGSKELFHSNFWAWLIEQNGEYAKIFFKKIDCSNLDVQREEKGRDITITSQKKKYVIENKLKSMPDLEQLVKYTDDLKDSFEGGVLTGIKKPKFILPKGWNFVSYKEITDEIEKIAILCNNEFVKNVTLQYVKDLRNVFKLINSFEEITGQNFPGGDTKIIEKLSNKAIRLWDVCQKYKTEEFAKILEVTLKDFQSKIQESGFELSIETGFSHSTSFLDVRFIRARGEEEEVSIGVQLQSGQYRRFATLCGNNSSENVYKTFKKYGWFEEYNKNSKYIFGQESSMKKSYCCFNGGTKVKYYFVDQHYIIKNYSFADLTDRIKKDLEQAVTIVNKYYKK